FTPPSLQGTLVFPGNLGMFEWGGIAVDPVRQIAIANPMSLPFRSRLIPRGPQNPPAPTAEKPVGSEVGTQPMYGTPFGVDISSFLSPLTNRRTDEYGGSIENCARYPLEVFRAIRAVWPEDKPMSVRLSCHDWAEAGNTPEDALAFAKLFKAAGADLIDCTSGQVWADDQPIYGRLYQTPFADKIRNEVGIATIAVGAISEADHANSIIAAGRADLCAIARPHLADPAWTLHE
ncbi:hypothetical protein NS115_24800, partial [Paenibacillus jamilae]